jgi:transcriptional regulator with GAF, ATPase, and Fis domain
LETRQALQPFEQLTMSLSASMATLSADEAGEHITDALRVVGMTFDADECTLVSYREGAEARVTGSWAAPPHGPCRHEDLGCMPWLLQRVARNAVVAVTSSNGYPESAAADRAYAARTGLVARLAVPVVLGPRPCFAMMLGSHQRQPDWNESVIERLRFVGEILGGGVERMRRYESARVAHVNGSRPERRGSSKDGIVGDSAGMRLAMERLEQVAPLDVTVLLRGETGTGKELFARALHDRSSRQGQALVRVDCAALPPTLIESELFGHERGAFTGATTMRQGRFELADGGTIFLDEIGDLAPDLQAKLLRVLQEGEFERVGSSKVRQVDVRVVAATHVDLDQAVAQGRFRADLFYRLNVFPITLPPLRERREDIPDLVWAFIKRRQHALGRLITSVPAAAMDALQRHDWAGNVRELENVIERAMIRATSGTLHLEECLDPSPAAAQPMTGTGETLDALQRRYIEKVLQECGGRINGVGNAAVRLGLHPNTLRFRIKKLGVVMPRRGNGSQP